MNKLIAFIIVLITLIPIACADLKIAEIKGYINNEVAPGIDEDGGDFYVKAKDNIDVVVSLENTENTTTRAKLVGTLENIDRGDDIEKTQDWYDISANDKRSKTLSFNIPSDVNIDDYDLELTIYYRFSNGTELSYNRDYDVIVEKQEETTVNLQDILNNMTLSCNNLVKTTDTCFGYVGRFDNCSDELSTVKEDRGTYKQKSEDLEGRISTCNTEKSETEQQKISLENRMNSMLTIHECNNQTNSAVQSERTTANNKMNNTIMMFGGGVLVYFVYQNRKKRKSSVVDSYYYEKGLP